MQPAELRLAGRLLGLAAAGFPFGDYQTIDPDDEAVAEVVRAAYIGRVPVGDNGQVRAKNTTLMLHLGCRMLEEVHQEEHGGDLRSMASTMADLMLRELLIRSPDREGPPTAYGPLEEMPF